MMFIYYFYFKQVARDYASRNPMMAPGHACGFDFKDGITNGNYWYKVTGGKSQRIRKVRGNNGRLIPTTGTVYSLKIDL
jgi:hypothetical protein